jgi:kinesin family protein C2/C3
MILFVFVLVPDIEFTLDIRASLNNGLLNLPDAKIYPVQSPSDVINLMQLGEKHRASGSTAINHRSSRSHRFAQLH